MHRWRTLAGTDETDVKLSFEFRASYAQIAATGDVGGEDAASLCESARDRAGRNEGRRVLVDLRDAALSRDARDAMLDFARAPEASSAAMVTSDELFVAEVNMASLAAGSRARAFTQHSDAHRWLSRGSMVKTAMDLPKDHPRYSERPLDPEARRRALFDVPPRTRPPGPTPRSLPPEPESERLTASTERPTYSTERPPAELEPRRDTQRPVTQHPVTQRPTTERPTLVDAPTRKR
jgi:hypothetical protein